MCVCCCTNECAKWFLECVTSSSSSYPSSGYSEELLFGVHGSPDEEKLKPGINEEPSEEKLEHCRVKREHRLRATSLLNASYIINASEDMFHQTSSHNRKQLFNGHGYNLAMYKGHVRGKYFFINCAFFTYFHKFIFNQQIA